MVIGKKQPTNQQNVLEFGVFVFFLATDATYPEFPWDCREVSTGTPRILAEIF